MRNLLSGSFRRVAVIGFVVLLLVGIPLTIYLTQQQQNLQQSAHTIQPSVQTTCQNGHVMISYTFVVTNLPNGVTAHTTVVDSQNYATDQTGFTTNPGDSPYTKSVDTHQNQIQAGLLTFTTTATDGFTATAQKSYPATGPCATPTPVPSLTPTPTIPASTPTRTPTPTNTPTSTPANTPTPTGSILSATETPTPTLTPTPTGSILSATETPTPTPTGTQIAANNTPTPTIAATGPSNLFLPIGGIIAGMVVIGGLLFFLL